MAMLYLGTKSLGCRALISWATSVCRSLEVMRPRAADSVVWAIPRGVFFHSALILGVVVFFLGRLVVVGAEAARGPKLA